MTTSFYTLDIRHENDIAIARQQTRQLAEWVGLDPWRQSQLATAVTETAWDALQGAGGGQLQFSLDDALAPTQLWVELHQLHQLHQMEPAQSTQQATPDSTRVKNNQGTRTIEGLVDHYTLGDGSDGHYTVRLGQSLPTSATRPIVIKTLADQLQRLNPHPATEEFRRQNLELMQALAELQRIQQENAELNGELENTNRGVVALYAELDDKAEQLRRADELKTHFFSNMSHEFRTPVNSILALSRILLDKVDGDLEPEQAKQVSFIRRAAQDLGDLVSDLLDLIKVEAGRATTRPSQFELESLFGALRGMFRPLANNPSVNLVFNEPDTFPGFHTDEAQVAQILRNFISNALKFTEVGEVRVSVRLAPGSGEAIFAVADTGIGIAPEDQERIFHEFTQIENPIQRHVKGTGLGLSLSKRLAELLGGSVSLKSHVGRGSTFSLRIPLRHPNVAPPASDTTGEAPAKSFLRFLIIDDDEIARYVLKGYLMEEQGKVLEATDGTLGLRLALETQPDIIFLDLVMPGLSGFDVLTQLKANPATRNIPVIVVTSQVLDDEERRELLSRAIAILSKQTASRDAALLQLHQALAKTQVMLSRNTA